MLNKVCRYLKNWFVKTYYIGAVTVSDGAVSVNGEPISMNEGDYFALVRTRYVYGVYQYGDEIEDSTFDGAVWVMDVPPEILAILPDLTAWETANGAESPAASPYQSESFGGYSYNKANTGDGKVGASVFDVATFKAALDPFKKL